MKTNVHSGFPFKNVIDHDDAKVLVKVNVVPGEIEYILWEQVKPGHYRIFGRSPFLGLLRPYLNHHKKVA